MKKKLRYDIAIIGAGHAGCEAANVCSRLNARTVLFTVNYDNVALMPCNPAVGGPGKSHLVFELTSLSGLIGKCADMSAIQVKMLNESKGAAVQSLRIQVERHKYHRNMLRLLNNCENLYIKQAIITGIEKKAGKICGVYTNTGMFYEADIVIICTGTYMDSYIVIGERKFKSGPNYQPTSKDLAISLKKLGLRLDRFQTATPPRVDKRTVDFSKLIKLPPSNKRIGFSKIRVLSKKNELPTYLAYTNENTVEILSANLKKSPIIIGNIKGHGPRYCPSIDRKLLRYPDITRHQILVEPEGNLSIELYLQGFTTSMPLEVQRKALNTIKGFEKAKIVRPGYAIDYLYCNPNDLAKTLEYQKEPNLFLAGQINGTTGYEEAAVQGFLAGINAVLKLKNKKPFVLSRYESYIGVLIDDLVTKKIEEPYRIFTSRAENRLYLRQDNAFKRMFEYAVEFGLLGKKQENKLKKRIFNIKKEFLNLKSFKIKPSQGTIKKLKLKKKKILKNTVSAFEFLKRDDIFYKDLKEFEYNSSQKLSLADINYIENEIKYSVYIERQKKEFRWFQSLENIRIPPEINYSDIPNISFEGREKLHKYKPLNLKDAFLIQGISPSDILSLIKYLRNRDISPKRSGRKSPSSKTNGNETHLQKPFTASLPASPAFCVPSSKLASMPI